MRRRRILAAGMALALLTSSASFGVWAEEGTPVVEQSVPEPAPAPDPAPAAEPAPAPAAPEPTKASEPEKSEPTDAGEPVQSTDADKPEGTEGKGDTANPDETEKPVETEKPEQTTQPEETTQPGETEQPSETETPGETPQPEGTVQPDETEEPEEEPAAGLSLGGLSASSGKVAVGETVNFSFEASGADSVTWHAVRSDGANAASGAADEGHFSWTPSATGKYTVTVTAMAGEASMTASATVVVANGAFRVWATADRRYAFAGRDAISFDAGVSGGAQPYAVELRILENGQEVYTANEADGVIYTPKAFGEVVLRLIATDAEGSLSGAEVRVEVPVDEREPQWRWERRIPEFTDDMTFAQKLVAVAKSQVGYTESSRNFIIDDSGRKVAYSRYGDWYGMNYEEWCAMFVAFCMSYAGIPESAIPFEPNNQRWKEALGRLYNDEEDIYDPEPGDIVFFHREGRDDSSDPNFPNHVGIVVRVTEDRLYTVEGNSGGKVRAVDYELRDEGIVGYVSMAEVMAKHDPNYESKKYATVQTGEHVTVTVAGETLQDGRVEVVDGRAAFCLEPDEGWQITGVSFEGLFELIPEDGVYALDGIKGDIEILVSAEVRQPEADEPEADDAEIEAVEPADEPGEDSAPKVVEQVKQVRGRRIRTIWLKRGIDD